MRGRSPLSIRPGVWPASRSLTGTRPNRSGFGFSPGPADTGRLVDGEGRPRANFGMQPFIILKNRLRRTESPHWQNPIFTDATGRFHVEGLAAGVEYRLFYEDMSGIRGSRGVAVAPLRRQVRRRSGRHQVQRLRLSKHEDELFKKRRVLRVGQALPDDVENGRHVAQEKRGWIEPETGENEAAEAAALVLPKPQVFTIAKHKPVKLSVEDAPDSIFADAVSTIRVELPVKLDTDRARSHFHNQLRAPSM